MLNFVYFYVARALCLCCSVILMAGELQIILSVVQPISTTYCDISESGFHSSSYKAIEGICRRLICMFKSMR